jgi:hypothetical protein
MMFISGNAACKGAMSGMTVCRCLSHPQLLFSTPTGTFATAAPCERQFPAVLRCSAGQTAGLPRFDLLAQVNEVEARQEEYTESLAFLGLVNALLEGLGANGLPAGGTAVAHYTALVLQYIAGNLWQRGYRCDNGCGYALCCCC